MVRVTFFLLIVLGYGWAFGQCDYCDDSRKGVFRSGAGLSIEGFPGKDYTTFGINGNMDYYLSDKVSLRGDLYYAIGDLDQSTELSLLGNHQLLSGFNYHPLKHKKLDPYVGAQVGAALTKVGSKDPWILTLGEGWMNESSNSVNPVAQINTGLNYYQDYFHFFLQGSYHVQKHNTAENPSLNLNNIRFLFGLGWNFSLKK